MILLPETIRAYLKRAAETKRETERRLLLSVIQNEVDRLHAERERRNGR